MLRASLTVFDSSYNSRPDYTGWVPCLLWTMESFMGYMEPADWAADDAGLGKNRSRQKQKMRQSKICVYREMVSLKIGHHYLWMGKRRPVIVAFRQGLAVFWKRQFGITACLSNTRQSRCLVNWKREAESLKGRILQMPLLRKEWS